MPLMPEFENDVAVQPVQMPTANPEPFMAPGRALAQGAGALSDQMAEFNQKYVEAKRAMAASQTVVGLGKQLNDLQHKWSLVPDRQQAIAGYQNEVAQLQKSSVDTIQDPFVRAHVTEQFGSEAIAREDEVGKQSFGLESSKHRGDLDQNLLTLSTQAAQAPNEHARAIIADNASAAIGGAVAGGWISPEEGSEHGIRFKSDVLAVNARDDINNAIDKQDPDAMYRMAQKLGDPANYPGMLQDTREALRGHAETMAYRLQMRSAQREAHNDAMAERGLHQAQAHNEAVLLAHVNAGATMSDSDIEAMADKGQITAGGVEALHTARDRAEEGHDDPSASIPLWHAVNQNNIDASDVYKVFQAGKLSKTTATDMVKALDAKGDKGDNAGSKANYGVLKTALSGGAVEQGLLGKDPTVVQNWAAAQGEWNRRVTIGGEDSQAVLSDMVPRYSSAFMRPTWLPPTKFGPVNSTKDVMARAGQLAGALKSKAISQSDFEAQASILTDYRNFYTLEDQRAAAAAKARAKKPPIEPGGNE